MEPDVNPIEQPPPRAIITIRMEANGVINTSFPSDVVLCFGMLKCAENTVTDHFRAMNAPRVVQSNGLHPEHGAIRRLLG